MVGVLLAAAAWFLPIYSTTAQRGSATSLLSNAKQIGVAIALHQRTHGKPPASLKEIDPELGLGPDVFAYPDLVDLPPDRRDLSPESFKLRWIYFPPRIDDPSQMILASPLPIRFRSRDKKSLKRIIVRADTSAMLIEEAEFAAELEALIGAEPPSAAKR